MPRKTPSVQAPSVTSFWPFSHTLVSSKEIQVPYLDIQSSRDTVLPRRRVVDEIFTTISPYTSLLSHFSVLELRLLWGHHIHYRLVGVNMSSYVVQTSVCKRIGVG